MVSYLAGNIAFFRDVATDMHQLTELSPTRETFFKACCLWGFCPQAARKATINLVILKTVCFTHVAGSQQRQN